MCNYTVDVFTVLQTSQRVGMDEKSVEGQIW